jgi:hypothetical protein
MTYPFMRSEEPAARLITARLIDHMISSPVGSIMVMADDMVRLGA